MHLEPPERIYAGVDTHADTHHVAVIDRNGARIRDAEFPATADGYRDVVTFLTQDAGSPTVGVECTGSYGAELTRILTASGIEVREIHTPGRTRRRIRGKSDPLDAYEAAQSVLADRGTSTPKSRTGVVESLRVLMRARASAVKARTHALTQISSLLVTAPDNIRSSYRGITIRAKTEALSALSSSGELASPEVATVMTLRLLARRCKSLATEVDELTAQLETLLRAHAPALLHLNGVGTVSAAQILVTMGDNPERVESEAKFAALVGVAPIPASSGKTDRHRLSRGGDRAANSAIHTVVNRPGFDGD